MGDLDTVARSIEARLTPQQKQRAFEMARENGWGPGSRPPTAFWIEWFRKAEMEYQSD